MQKIDRCVQAEKQLTADSVSQVSASVSFAKLLHKTITSNCLYLAVLPQRLLIFN